MPVFQKGKHAQNDTLTGRVYDDAMLILFRVRWSSSSLMPNKRQFASFATDFYDETKSENKIINFTRSDFFSQNKKSAKAMKQKVGLGIHLYPSVD